MLQSILKVAKVAIVGYIAYKAIDALTSTSVEDKEDVVTQDTVEESNVEAVDGNKVLKIAGGIAIVYLIMKNRRLTAHVGNLQTLVAANKFNSILLADRVGMFNGPNRLRILDSNLNAVDRMTRNPIIHDAVKQAKRSIHLGIGGELYD